MFTGAAVVMGVAGCGKTSVGEALAEQLGARFVEGDTLHPRSNVQKMSSGIPLTDDDRWPWLTRIGETMRGNEGIVASCSALKLAYREHITAAAQRPVSFIYLHGSRELLERRMAARTGHFMPPSLLASQLATLESPSAHERAMGCDIDQSVEKIVDQARTWLLQQQV
jgi:gluconokinase